MMQILEPTGGEIVRPEDWHFAERHDGNSWMWTISKEDTKDGKLRYETGVRIQAFMEVSEKAGQTAEAFIQSYFDKKEGEASKIYSVCEAVDLGLFRRRCLEVKEGKYRILYSLFWNNEMDVMVFSISGAKANEWKRYAETFDRMSSFKLIDRERFGANGGDRAPK